MKYMSHKSKGITGIGLSVCEGRRIFEIQQKVN
jgi:hypothetical protein